MTRHFLGHRTLGFRLFRCICIIYNNLGGACLVLTQTEIFISFLVLLERSQIQTLYSLMIFFLLGFCSLMFSSGIFSTILVLPIIVSAQIDPIWSSGDKSGSEAPSDGTLFSSNLALLPLDPAASLFSPAQSIDNSDSFFQTDLSDSLFENTDDDFILADGAFNSDVDEDFDLVDCSTSTLIPTINKWRVRRADNSGSCNNPASNSIPFPNNNQNNIPDNPGNLDDVPPRPGVVTDTKEDYSLTCLALTMLQLPYGVCPATNPDGRVEMRDRFLTPGGYDQVMYMLNHCTPGMSPRSPINFTTYLYTSSLSCADWTEKFFSAPSQFAIDPCEFQGTTFYCCGLYFLDKQEAYYCIPFSSLAIGPEGNLNSE